MTPYRYIRMQQDGFRRLIEEYGERLRVAGLSGSQQPLHLPRAMAVTGPRYGLTVRPTRSDSLLCQCPYIKHRLRMAHVIVWDSTPPPRSRPWIKGRLSEPSFPVLSPTCLIAGNKLHTWLRWFDIGRSNRRRVGSADCVAVISLVISEKRLGITTARRGFSQRQRANNRRTSERILSTVEACM